MRCRFGVGDLLIPPTGVAKTSRAGRVVSGCLVLVLLARSAGYAHLLGAASRDHSSDCTGAKSGQFNRSADGDRFRSVWFGHGVDIDRPQNAVVQDKNSAADNSCLQGRSLT
jgi:hypothetical protein